MSKKKFYLAIFCAFSKMTRQKTFCNKGCDWCDQACNFWHLHGLLFCCCFSKPENIIKLFCTHPSVESLGYKNEIWKIWIIRIESNFFAPFHQPRVLADLKFVKKFTRPKFWAKEFYTLKMRKSILLSPAINSKNASLLVIWPSFG